MSQEQRDPKISMDHHHQDIEELPFDDPTSMREIENLSKNGPKGPHQTGGDPCQDQEPHQTETTSGFHQRVDDALDSSHKGVHLPTRGREVPYEEVHEDGCRIGEPGCEDEPGDPDEEHDQREESHQEVKGDGSRHEENVVFVGLG